MDAGQGRQWWLPNISSLSRGRGKLGADPVRMLFEHVAGPVAADGAPGVFCCGLRVVSMDGSVTDVPDSEKNAAFFGRPSNQSRDRAFPQARWVAAAESGTGSLLGAAIGRYTDAEQPPLMPGVSERRSPRVRAPCSATAQAAIISSALAAAAGSPVGGTGPLAVGFFSGEDCQRGYSLPSAHLRA